MTCTCKCGCKRRASRKPNPSGPNSHFEPTIAAANNLCFQCAQRWMADEVVVHMPKEPSR